MPGETEQKLSPEDAHFIVDKRAATNPFNPLTEPEEFSDWEQTFNAEVVNKKSKKPHHKFNRKSDPHNERLIN